MLKESVSTDMSRGFEQEIKDFLYDRIGEMEGSSVEGADLVHELTLDENNTGAWVIYTAKANDFVEKYRTDALDTIAYYRDNFGADFIDEKLGLGEYGEPWEVFADDYVYDEDGNVISEPDFDDIDLLIANGKSEVMTFFMLYYGVDLIVPQLPCVEEVWDEEFEIDEDFVERFKREMA